MAIEVESNFKFAQQLDILISVSLRKYASLEDMREDGGAKNTCLWT